MVLQLQREKWGGGEVGDGVIVLQLDDVRFIGIIVYIYDSKKRNKPSHIHLELGRLTLLSSGLYKLVASVQNQNMMLKLQIIK